MRASKEATKAVNGQYFVAGVYIGALAGAIVTVILGLVTGACACT